VLSTHLSALLGILVTPLASQSTQRVPLPQEIVADLVPRFQAEDGEFSTADQVAKSVEAQTHDLNGDGTPEYVVKATMPQFCLADDYCYTWVYGRMPDGRYHRLLETISASVNVQLTGTNGYRDLEAVAHWTMGAHSFFQFGERGYVDVGRDLRKGEELSFRIRSPLPGPGQPGRVELDERAAGSHPTVRFAAEYTACASERATPGQLCGEPRLVLSEPQGAGLLPSPGPACFQMEAKRAGAGLTPAGSVQCAAGETGGTGQRRSIVLQLSPAQWNAVRHTGTIRLVASRLTLNMDDDADVALRVFLGRVYNLNGMAMYPHKKTAE
jgi:hypothetical protein